MPQALEYAKVFDVPFAYSCNGDAFLEHDRTLPLASSNAKSPSISFPSPSNSGHVIGMPRVTGFQEPFDEVLELLAFLAGVCIKASVESKNSLDKTLVWSRVWYQRYALSVCAVFLLATAGCMRRCTANLGHRRPGEAMGRLVAKPTFRNSNTSIDDSRG